MPVSEAARDKDRDVVHATRRTAAGGSAKAAVLAWRGAHDLGGVGGQDLLEQFPVHGAEIDVALEVAVVEVGQGRLLAVEAAADRCAMATPEATRKLRRVTVSRWVAASFPGGAS
jgi:hypothetical protein